MAKEKQVYIETYHKPYPRVVDDKLPELKHVPMPELLAEVAVKAAGVVERGDERFEFQDIRLYFKVPTETSTEE